MSKRQDRLLIGAKLVVSGICYLPSGNGRVVNIALTPLNSLNCQEINPIHVIAGISSG